MPNRAYGHSRENNAIVQTDQSPTSATLGDGGIYSNLDDLAEWDEALWRHKLLSEAEMQAALTPFHLAGGAPCPYGTAAPATPISSTRVIE